jgi:enediyne biosynthesis protein CalE5
MEFDFERVAAAWDRWFAVREAAVGTVSERLVAAARIAPGAIVLDIGTGPGEPAFTAARAAGENGRVIGVDISPAMVETARRRAEREGFSNVRFVTSDGLTNVPEGPYDAVVSRWGMMFFSDLEAVLRGVLALLRPGGSFAAATWGKAQEVPHLSLPMTHMRTPDGAPPDLTGGPFALSDPAALERRLRSCGFIDVRIEPLEVVYTFGSAGDFFAHVSDIAPSVSAYVGRLDDRARAAFRHAVEDDAAQRFGLPDGTIRLPNNVLIASGIRRA